MTTFSATFLLGGCLKKMRSYKTQAIRELTPWSIKKFFQLENYHLKIILINFQKIFFL